MAIALACLVPREVRGGFVVLVLYLLSLRGGRHGGGGGGGGGGSETPAVLRRELCLGGKADDQIL